MSYCDQGAIHIIPESHTRYWCCTLQATQQDRESQICSCPMKRITDKEHIYAEKIVWTEAWSSDRVEHDGNDVSALTYVPFVDGLNRDSTHGGWLLSASKQLINLWECSPGRSEPYLQVHSSRYHSLFAIMVLVSSFSVVFISSLLLYQRVCSQGARQRCELWLSFALSQIYPVDTIACLPEDQAVLFHPCSKIQAIVVPL